jgi:hypothetical protein
MFYVSGKKIFLLSLLIINAFSCPSFSDVTKEMIKENAQYSGLKTEKKLNDLLRSDYYQQLSTYYLNKKDAGFMALERFELAFIRAIGDIRILSQEKDNTKRQELAIEAFNNWTTAFKRAQIKNFIPNK